MLPQAGQISDRQTIAASSCLSDHIRILSNLQSQPDSNGRPYGIGRRIHPARLPPWNEALMELVRESEEDSQYRLAEPLDDWREKSEQRRKERLAGFQAELVDTLLDYGPTLSELGDDQWVAVAVYLGERFITSGGDSGKRLILKVRMRDLRQYSAGRISRSVPWATKRENASWSARWMDIPRSWSIAARATTPSASSVLIS